MKKFTAILLAAVLVASMMAGCGTQQPAPTEVPEKGKATPVTGFSDEKAAEIAEAGELKEINVGYSVATMEGSFWVAVPTLMKLAAEKYETEHDVKINIDMVVADNDAGKQKNDIKDLIAKKPHVIIITPMDSTAILSSIKECHDAGIPVITTARQENPEATGAERADVYVGLDTLDQAYTAGIEIINRMISDGYVIEDIKCLNLVGDLADENAVNRSNGFKKACEEKGVAIMQDIPFEWDAEKCTNLLSAALVAHPESNLIFQPSDSHLPGTQAALERNNMWHEYGEEGYVYIASQDGSIEGLPYVRDKYCLADTSYDHWPCCLQCIEYIVMLANGQTVPSSVHMISGRVVTPENIDTLENLWGVLLAK